MKYYLAERPYYVYLPKAIYEPLKKAVSQREGIELDSAVLIIHNILKLKFQDKNYEEGKDYVPLYSKVLEKYVKDYTKYLDFLEEEGFISCNAHYRTGKSKQFKLIDSYFEVPITVSESSIVPHKMTPSRKNENREKFLKQKMNEAAYRSPELSVWFEGKANKFSILYDEAIEYVNTKYSSYDDRYCRVKRILDIEKLHNGSILFSREGKDDRFHSNFTSIASDIKQFIRYDGKVLQEKDIKSAQPVVISVLFEEILKVLTDCYNNLPDKVNITKEDVTSFKRLLSKRIRNIIYKYTTKEYLDNIINTKEYIKSITIMFTKHFTTLDNAEFFAFKTEVENFIRLVRSGQYYEKLGEQLLEGNIIQEVVDIDTGELLYQVLEFDKKTNKLRLSKSDTLRNTAKSVMLNVIYMPAHEKRNKVINFFRFNNPAIAFLLKTLMLDTKSWNSDKHSNFPILIQQMESKAMLDYCVKRIAKKYPKMPLVTIHDSISTTEEYFDILERELNTLLLEYFGFKVMTGGKKWTGNNDELLNKAIA